MDVFFEERRSDSPYIESVWRGGAGKDYAPICPASSQWHMLFFQQNGKPKVFVQGPLTKATPVTQPEGTEWVGVTFPLGAFLPSLSIKSILNEQSVLPLTAKASFHLADSSWPIPDYENVETFIERLVRQGLLVSDPLVKAALIHQPVEMSWRTMRRRFILATGLSHKTIAQIERAKQATVLLEQGVSLIDAAYRAGYADQAHMARSLKQFIGYTPTLLAAGAGEEIWQ